MTLRVNVCVTLAYAMSMKADILNFTHQSYPIVTMWGHLAPPREPGVCHVGFKTRPCNAGGCAELSCAGLAVQQAVISWVLAVGLRTCEVPAWQLRAFFFIMDNKHPVVALCCVFLLDIAPLRKRCKEPL
jgi:hypothetical protein